MTHTSLGSIINFDSVDSLYLYNFIDLIVFRLVAVKILQTSESSTALLLSYEVLCALKVNTAENIDKIF